MASSAAIRFLSSRRGLIALAISLATVYTLTLYDAAAFASLSATATRPGSVSSSGLPAGKVGERKWTWGNGAGIMGDMGSSSDSAPQPVGGMPHQRYRADEDPILAIAGVRQQDVEDGAATKPPANHRARPFGKTEDALKPADRDEVEKAKAKAGVYAPHEVARLDAELAQAQAPKKAKAAAVAKKQKAGSETTQTEAGQKTVAARVDEASGSAPTSAAEDALEDAPSVAAKKGAADAAPMAALVLPVDKNKEAIAIPADDRKESDSATSAAEPASHAAARGASTPDDKSLHPPPSEKVRLAESGADGKPATSSSDASADDGSSVQKAAAGEKPKIGTGRRVVKPVAGDVIPKAAALQREKAGKVVKQEAGKRVGTGARPGAKGMGMRRRRLVRRA
ncbi:hypothetical protein BMF94_1224 [Rhodotorula taiwanensis]|uniref:Uncharacterized protein n=1 Tax=Rhodotorula taiwanensis TaxID=741276 RepID=A0A2S5BFP9_9BASI|nr:hypothetical protein BMF94_1224 [Rhodotorula taiwanensis]